MELAFVIPLVLLFLFGIIDFGLALNAKNSDTNVANLAVRAASLIGTTTTKTCVTTTGTTTESTLGDWVECEAQVTGSPVNTVCVADIATTPYTNGAYLAGDPVMVEVKSNFSWLKVVSSGSGTGLSSTLGSSATMRVEQGSTTTNSFLTNTPKCTS